MQVEEVKARIQAGIENAEVFPEGEGCSFQVVVVSEVFNGMTPVKKQQLVYSCLADKIADGSIHALTIKAYTPAQWQNISA
ncbi:cell division protein BolA [Pokkaliibacter plantistimulans]|uniref:Cell division protein BolA n=1 Tax=Pokkaliibacter plantistimulans TaxID=1635171 RepID=A0ABX5LYI6_9GAMM|nr:BolA/IbaG family iron-sulfur metabolism protein [Pokkaliibacter plantistimulans]PXF31735.1 cell division protein BolA [Pokkaliibacter plantistimulans]